MDSKDLNNAVFDYQPTLIYMLVIFLNRMIKNLVY